MIVETPGDDSQDLGFWAPTWSTCGCSLDDNRDGEMFWMARELQIWHIQDLEAPISGGQ